MALAVVCVTAALLVMQHGDSVTVGYTDHLALELGQRG
jgi:hypothetical protein